MQWSLLAATFGLSLYYFKCFGDGAILNTKKLQKRSCRVGGGGSNGPLVLILNLSLCCLFLKLYILQKRAQQSTCNTCQERDHAVSFSNVDSQSWYGVDPQIVGKQQLEMHELELLHCPQALVRKRRKQNETECTTSSQYIVSIYSLPTHKHGNEATSVICRYTYLKVTSLENPSRG